MVHATRARLLYGEWLRRENRRVDARAELRVAYKRFSRIGADAFAERARGELLATGETARKRRVDTRDELTPQEKQIARLARDGLSKPDIGARLFLSPRTAEFHRHEVLQMPNQIPLIVEHRIVAFSLGHPGLGPRRIPAMLARAEWGALGVSPNSAGASGPWCSCSPPGVGDRVTPSHQFFWV